MQYRGLFVGLTTVDIQYYTESFPSSNIKVKTKAPDILIGGPATNAAVAFSKLNNGAFLASPCGDNSFSEVIEQDFKQTGIEHTDLVEKQKVNPVIASVITSSNGDRNIFTHNPKNISSKTSVKELFKNINPLILLVDGFYPEFSIKCARYAKSLNIPVVIDCGSWKPQYTELLQYVDYAICSEDFYPPNCDISEQVFDYFKKNYKCKVAISRGGESIIFIDKEKEVVPVEKVGVVDTLGAGDFLHGAFCYYLLESNNFQMSLQKASKLASYTCAFKGTRKWLNKVNLTS